MIDELALGLAPMTVERLMGMVRRINEAGTTVILVEQSLNRALSLAAAVLLHGAGRDPLRRPDRRADGPRRPAAPGLPRHRARPAWARRRCSPSRHPSFVLVQGVIYGLGYGLLALGLVLVYRTNRVLNFAQGQIGVIAAVFLVKLTADFKFNYWFALVLSVGLAAAVGRRVGAGAAAALHPAPGAGHGGHHRAELGAVRAHRAALHPAQEPLQARPGALRPVLLARPVHHHARPRCSP